MKKLSLLLAVGLLLATSAEAAPGWVKKVAKKTFEYGVYAAPVVTAILATNAGHVCRQRNGVEACTAGYGAFAAVEGARFGVALTFSGLSMFGHKQHFKEWAAPALGMAAFNGAWAIHERRIHSTEPH
jgi:hypothetical protein